MRFFFILSVLILFTSQTGLSQNNSNIKIVDVARMLDVLEGEEGQVKVVNFWATWCKPCIEELPLFIDAAKANPQVEFVFISLDFSDNLDKVERFTKKKDMDKFPLYLIDNIDYNSWIDKVSPKWSGAIPMTLVIDGEQKLIYEKQFQENDLNELISKIVK